VRKWLSSCMIICGLLVGSVFFILTTWSAQENQIYKPGYTIIAQEPVHISNGIAVFDVKLCAFAAYPVYYNIIWKQIEKDTDIKAVVGLVGLAVTETNCTLREITLPLPEQGMVPGTWELITTLITDELVQTIQSEPFQVVY